MDQVYLKKNIRKDKIYEKHRNMIFGMIIGIFSVLFVASLIVADWLPMWLFWLIWIVIFGLLIYWIIKKNENANLTKSSAFIKRNGFLYYIRLGYSLDGDIPVNAMDMVIMGTKDAINSARAEENMMKTTLIQGMRDEPSTFSNYLTEILSMNGHLPQYVVSFCAMEDAKLEREDSRWIWISYTNQWTKGQRVTQKFRNVYGTEMFDNYVSK